MLKKKNAKGINEFLPSFIFQYTVAINSFASKILKSFLACPATLLSYCITGFQACGNAVLFSINILYFLVVFCTNLWWMCLSDFSFSLLPNLKENYANLLGKFSHLSLCSPLPPKSKTHCSNKHRGGSCLSVSWCRRLMLFSTLHFFPYMF